MTREEVIQGLQFTIEMFLFDPSTGETLTEPRNDMDKTTIDACKGAIELLKPQLKKGEWIFNENMHDYCCSECGCLMPNVNEYYRKKIIGCPYCLADMREVQEND